MKSASARASLIADLQPDLVHAMRLPFEGFLAAAAVEKVPLLISVWGNDFTLFANRSRKLRRSRHKLCAVQTLCSAIAIAI